MITFSTTTIKKYNPCEDGLQRLLDANHPDPERIAPEQILASNKVSDVIWCLRTLPKDAVNIAHLAVDLVVSVVPKTVYPKDQPAYKALQAARRYADGEISEEEVREAAYAAAAAAAAYAADAAYAYAATAAAYAAAAAADADAYTDAVADTAADAAYAAYAAAADAATDAARTTQKQVLLAYLTNQPRKSYYL